MILKFLAMVLIIPALCLAGVITDEFNRPDAADLGAPWTTVAGQMGISDNRAVAVGSAQGTNFAVLTGANSNIASMEVYAIGNALQYIAIGLGYSDPANMYFVKVQGQNGVPSFGHYAFYYGNNGTSLGGFASLDTPFSSGVMTVSLLGQIVTLEIDTDFDGTPDQVYSRNYGVSTEGTGVGIGIWGAAQGDNFNLGPYNGNGNGGEIPEPGTLLLLSAGLGLLALRRRLN